MPGPPYEYISGLILRYMEEPGFAGFRGRRVRGEEEPGVKVKSRDP